MINLRPVFLVLALLMHSAVQASPSTDALTMCLSDSTTGKDRKDMAKWFFVGMSAHPELGAMARPNAQATEATLRTIGALLTRLITEACPNEFRAVNAADGVEGIKVAFEFLGKVAMQELLTNQDVNRVIGGFERFIDKRAIEAVVGNR